MANFALQVLCGLVYLHYPVETQLRPRLFHADIKCDNIFLTDYGKNAQIKIGDLDNLERLEKFKELKSTKTFDHPKGTPAFIAPEFTPLRERNRVNVGRKADVWSFGCVVLQMLQRGQFILQHPRSKEEINPFEPTWKDTSIIDFVANGGAPLVSGGWRIPKQLFEACFKRNPDERPSSHDLWDKFRERLTEVERSDALESEIFWKKLLSPAGNV